MFDEKTKADGLVQNAKTIKTSLDRQEIVKLLHEIRLDCMVFDTVPPAPAS
jgi:hypothetical protein